MVEQLFDPLSEIVTLIQAIDDCDRPAKLRKVIVQKALAITGATRAELALWDPREQKLRIDMQSGHVAPTAGTQNHHVPEGGLMMKAWRARGAKPLPVYSDRLIPDDGYVQVDPATRAEAAIRLQHERRGIGVLNVEWHQPPTWSEDRKLVFGLLAEQAARAMMIAEREAALRELAGGLASEGEVATAICRALERISVNHGFDTALLYEADRERGVLEVTYRLERSRARLAKENGKPWSWKLDDAGLATTVYRRGEPEWEEDASNPKIANRRGIEKFAIKGSLLGLPLVHGGETLGALVVWDSQGHGPRKDSARALQPIADLLAGYLDPIDVTRRAIFNYDSLSELLRRAQGDISPQDVIDRVLQAVRSVGFDRARYYRYDRERRCFVGERKVGKAGNPEPLVLEIDISLRPHAARIVEQFKTTPDALVFDPANDPDLGPDPDCVKLDKGPKDPWIAAPVALNGELIGQLAADNPESRRPIPALARHLMSHLAGIAALLLDRVARSDLAGLGYGRSEVGTGGQGDDSPVARFRKDKESRFLWVNDVFVEDVVKAQGPYLDETAERALMTYFNVLRAQTKPDNATKSARHSETANLCLHSSAIVEHLINPPNDSQSETFHLLLGRLEQADISVRCKLIHEVVDQLRGVVRDATHDQAGSRSARHKRAISVLRHSILDRTDLQVFGDNEFSREYMRRDRIAMGMEINENGILKAERKAWDHEQNNCDGKVRLVRTVKWPIQDARGQVVGLEGYYFDDSLTRIFDHATEGMFQSLPGGSYIQMNQTMAQLLGYASPEAALQAGLSIPTDVYEVKAQRQFFKDELKRRGGCLSNFEYYMKRPGLKPSDGGEAPVIKVAEYAWAVMDKSGEPIFFEGIVRDLRDQIEISSAISKRQIEDLVVETAGEIAHEIRNIIKLIKLSAQEAATHRAPPSEGVLAASKDGGLGKIIEYADRAEKVLGSYQDRKNKKALKPAAIDDVINHFIKLTVPDLFGTSGSPQITSDLQCDGDVVVPAIELYQILTNFLINSTEAARRNQIDELRISIRTRLEASTDNRHPGWAVMTYEDTAGGMSDDQLNTLFLRNITIDPQDRHYGMLVVAKIVDAHGGKRIIATSDLSVGTTTFELFLPLATLNPSNPSALRK